MVELEGLTPVPGARPPCRRPVGAAQPRADRDRLLGLARPVGTTPGSAPIEAIVVPSDGHTYALLVEQVEDVVEATGAPVPFKASLGPGWSRVSTGMVEAGDDLLLLADPHALIAGPPLEEAA